MLGELGNEIRPGWGIAAPMRGLSTPQVIADMLDGRFRRGQIYPFGKSYGPQRRPEAVRKDVEPWEIRIQREYGFMCSYIYVVF
jgi:hypothetical protein